MREVWAFYRALGDRGGGGASAAEAEARMIGNCMVVCWRRYEGGGAQDVAHISEPSSVVVNLSMPRRQELTLGGWLMGRRVLAVVTASSAATTDDEGCDDGKGGGRFGCGSVA
jgi:hypothetical protein